MSWVRVELQPDERGDEGYGEEACRAEDRACNVVLKRECSAADDGARALRGARVVGVGRMWRAFVALSLFEVWVE